MSFEPFLRLAPARGASCSRCSWGSGSRRQWQAFLLWRHSGVVQFGDTRSGVRPRRGVLRLHPAVAAVHPGLAVLGARRRHGPHGDRALPVGRDPAAGAAVGEQGHPRGARAPVGAARADHAGEGLGLLPRAVRPAELAAGGRGGRVLHRRPGAVAGAELADLSRIICAVLFFANIRRQRMGLPDHRRRACSALVSIMLGTLYPAFVQRFRVTPQELQLELPVHRGQHRGHAPAFALDRIIEAQRDVGGARTVRAPRRTWGPSRTSGCGGLSVLAENFESLQRFRQYYEFLDVDVDRYDLDGDRGCSDLGAGGRRRMASRRGQTWQNRAPLVHPRFGAVASRVNTATPRASPVHACRISRPSVTRR